jgi:hypothetical protein
MMTITLRCRLQTSSKSFFPSTIKLWNSLPDNVKSLPTFSKFIKTIQPVQIPVASFYNIGNRKTKLRHTCRCSGLNADLFRVNLKNDPRCVCGHLFEDAIKFFLERPLHQHYRTSLFNYFNNICSHLYRIYTLWMLRNS